ncbi:hypothetical protein V8E54_002526 [Elaphomyces granulatus]
MALRHIISLDVPYGDRDGSQTNLHSIDDAIPFGLRTQERTYIWADGYEQEANHPERSSLDSSQGNRLAASQAPPEQEKTSAAKEPLPKANAGSNPLSSKRLSGTNRIESLSDSPKTVNSALPSGKEVETVSSVGTGIALILKTETTTDDLLRSKEKTSEAEGSKQTKDGDVTIERAVLPEVAGALGVSPETAYWANVREGCPTASVILAFQADGLKDSPRTVVLLGARLKVEYPVSRGVKPRASMYCTGQRGAKMRRDAGPESSDNHIKCANCMQRTTRRAR